MNKKTWTYKKLGDICKVVMGQSPDGKSVNNSNGIEFHQGKVFFGEKYLNPSNTFTEQPSKIAEPNSVLLCVRAPVGVVNLTLRRICIGRGLCAILPNDNIILPFLYYTLTTKQVYFDKNSTGSTFKAISSKVVTNTTIPVPSIDEQERIVAELDLLSSIIDKKKAQLKEYDQLAQSIFYDMFGDPVTNEKGWEVKKMNEVCREIGDGLHGTPQYDPNGNIAFINGNNLIDGRVIITEKTQFVNELEANKIYIELDSNTILLSINGTLGKTATYNNERIVLGKSACYLKLASRLNVLFVMALMNTSTFKLFLENNSSKSTIKNVGLKAIRNYLIILPPLSLQQEFAERIEAIEMQKALVRASIAETETLFNSRMDYYFG